MSTLKVNDIEEATSGGGKIFPARAWVNFSGTGTISINDDGNVSSLTDETTGSYTINLSNNMASANYAPTGNSNFNNNRYGPYNDGQVVLRALSASSVYVFCTDGGGGINDQYGVYVTVTGYQ